VTCALARSPDISPSSLLRVHILMRYDHTNAGWLATSIISIGPGPWSERTRGSWDLGGGTGPASGETVREGEREGGRREGGSREGRAQRNRTDTTARNQAPWFRVGAPGRSAHLHASHQRARAKPWLPCHAQCLVRSSRQRVRRRGCHTFQRLHFGRESLDLLVVGGAGAAAGHVCWR
jgi:hypothetical protein